ncbi:MAG TPA: hypothetical protein PKA38_02940 [Candidatus Levybacteria bacterium]|nr:hypothetical protein [Candidatus Levybacteria bacterium]
MHHLRNILLVLVLLTALTGCGFVFFSTNLREQKKLNTTIISPQIPQGIAEAKEEVRSVTSSDGLKKLTLSVKSGEGLSTYSVLSDSETTPFYTETLSQNTSLGLPDNAFSPGEKYLFLEKNGGGVKNALVFATDKSLFENNTQFLDVYSLYASKNLPNKFAGATGWADRTLLIIETTKEDGTKGSKYWFDVPSQSFIQLAR